MTVKQLIEKLQGLPQDWPVAIKVHEMGNFALYEFEPEKYRYYVSEVDKTNEVLLNGQQVVVL